MRRVLGVLALVAVAASIGTTVAQAKQVGSVTVCGAEECRNLEGKQRFLDLFNVYLPPTHRPDRLDRAHWLLVRVTIVVPGSRVRPEAWTTRFYPNAGAIHDPADGWRRVPSASLNAYQHAAAGMVPSGTLPRPPAASQLEQTASSPAGSQHPFGALAIIALGSLAVVCAGVAWRVGLRRRGRQATRGF